MLFRSPGLTESEVFKSYAKQPYLVIDELQERAHGEWDSRILTNLIDHRYADMLSTVIIANRKPDELADEVGRSVLARTQEVGQVVNCDWMSYREKK